MDTKKTQDAETTTGEPETGEPETCKECGVTHGMRNPSAEEREYVRVVKEVLLALVAGGPAEPPLVFVRDVFAALLLGMSAPPATHYIFDPLMAEVVEWGQRVRAAGMEARKLHGDYLDMRAN